MDDDIIVDLYWARSEQAISETDARYGKYCRTISFNILANAGADAPFVKQSVFHFHLHLVAGARTAEFKNVVSEICR